MFAAVTEPGRLVRQVRERLVPVGVELPIPTPNGFDSVVAVRVPAWADFLPNGVQVLILGERGAVVDWSMASEGDVPADMKTTDVLKASIALRQLIAVAMKMGGIPDKVSQAWFVVTTDPEVVEKYGMAHECPTCRAAVDQALTALRNHPETPLVVGILAF